MKIDEYRWILTGGQTGILEYNFSQFPYSNVVTFHVIFLLAIWYHDHRSNTGRHCGLFLSMSNFMQIRNVTVDPTDIVNLGKFL